jgi:hypothetical protein
MGPVHDSMRKELPSISKFQHHAIVVDSRQPVPWDDFRLARHPITMSIEPLTGSVH